MFFFPFEEKRRTQDKQLVWEQAFHYYSCPKVNGKYTSFVSSSHKKKLQVVGLAMKNNNKMWVRQHDYSKVLVS